MIDLKSKAGPLPVWAWGAILGVGAVAFIYWRSSNAAASSATVVSTPPDGTLDPTVDYQAAGLGASSGTDSGAVTTTPVDNPYQNNDSWISGVVQWLNGQGQDPIKVRGALQAYINGGILTADQVAIIKKAIGYAGDAPDGLAGTPTEAVVPTTPAGGSVVAKPTPATHLPPKAPPTKPAPIKVTHYVIRKGDSLSGIAKHFYGSASSANILKLQRANHLANPNLIIAGHSLVVPK